MTWLLYSTLHFIILWKNALWSLKLLKANHEELNEDCDKNIHKVPSYTLADLKYRYSIIDVDIAKESKDLLICWILLGLLLIWDNYLEIFFVRIIRWIPFYYYGKCFLLIIIGFPQLRLAHLLFYDILIPIMTEIDNRLKLLGISSPLKLLEYSIFIMVHAIFPIDIELQTGIQYDKSVASSVSQISSDIFVEENNNDTITSDAQNDTHDSQPNISIATTAELLIEPIIYKSDDLLPNEFINAANNIAFQTPVKASANDMDENIIMTNRKLSVISIYLDQIERIPEQQDKTILRHSNVIQTDEKLGWDSPSQDEIVGNIINVDHQIELSMNKNKHKHKHSLLVLQDLLQSELESSTDDCQSTDPQDYRSRGSLAVLRNSIYSSTGGIRSALKSLSRKGSAKNSPNVNQMKTPNNNSKDITNSNITFRKSKDNFFLRSIRKSKANIVNTINE